MELIDNDDIASDMVSRAGTIIGLTHRSALQKTRDQLVFPTFVSGNYWIRRTSRLFNQRVHEMLTVLMGIILVLLTTPRWRITYDELLMILTNGFYSLLCNQCMYLHMHGMKY